MSRDCGDCRFFQELPRPAQDPDVPEGKLGHCKRYPPVMVTDLATTTTVPVHSKSNSETHMRWYPTFPRVQDSEWCGEHQPVRRM